MVFSNLLEAAAPCWSRRLGDSGFGLHHFLNCRSDIPTGLYGLAARSIVCGADLGLFCDVSLHFDEMPEDELFCKKGPIRIGVWQRFQTNLAISPQLIDYE